MIHVFLIFFISSFSFGEVTDEEALVRGMVPLGLKHTYGAPEGAFRYNPDRSIRDRKNYSWLDEVNPLAEPEIDSYINKETKCALLSLLKEWRVNHCPDTEEIVDVGGYKHPNIYELRGCRVSIGDISHRIYQSRGVYRRSDGKKISSKYVDDGTMDQWVHATHTNGHCIDFRPFRKGRFKYEFLSVQKLKGHGDKWERHQQEYDRGKTAEFIRLAKEEYGATEIYFADPEIYQRSGSSYIPGVEARNHKTHIHVCMYPENIPKKYQCVNE